jgi:hypothetical protein
MLKVKEMDEDSFIWRWKVPIAILMAGIILIFMVFVSSNNCGSKTYGLSGELTGWKIYDTEYGGYLLYIENGTFHFDGDSEPAYHIEHWFSEIGNYNLDNYIEKNIMIEYNTGCGQTVIKNIEVR